jgi:DNA repair photolyase
MIERDIDILAEMAQQNLVSVALSITTLNRDLSRRLEPRAAAPQRRLETVQKLSAAGIPVSVLIAPLIPVLTDSELETIMEQARHAGARSCGYVLLRLPHELKELFQQWLHEHQPLKAEHVMNRIRDCRGGKEYQAEFGTRMSGEGIFADLLRQRYQRAMKRLEFEGMAELETQYFIKPRKEKTQMELF